ncbi:hypothetical protein CHUAL_010497, partial [Chamberlinius hualienensis]
MFLFLRSKLNLKKCEKKLLEIKNPESRNQSMKVENELMTLVEHQKQKINYMSQLKELFRAKEVIKVEIPIYIGSPLVENKNYWKISVIGTQQLELNIRLLQRPCPSKWIENKQIRYEDVLPRPVDEDEE